MSSVSNIFNDRARVALLILGIAAIVVIVILLIRSGSEDNGGAPADPTPASEVAASPTPAIQEAAGSPAVSQISDRTGAAPDATPLATADAIGPDVCKKGCLVRVPAADVTNLFLDDTGERPSYQSDEWLWSIVSRATVDELDDEGVPVRLVQDSLDTLYLHAIRLPEEHADLAPVRDFGEVLDSVDVHAIVRVETVPAVVTNLVSAGSGSRN